MMRYGLRLISGARRNDENHFGRAPTLRTVDGGTGGALLEFGDGSEQQWRHGC